MNEELQSTNEELEISKEELQSLNEELTTVNSQLQDKLEDLDTANSDLTNLMAATEIATIFLDIDHCIKRFTPSIARIVSLLESDIGRPLRDFAPRIRDENLLDDAERVLESLRSVERAIRTDADHWFLRRMLPYRTVDGRVGGVVMTFVDITSRVHAEAQSRRLAKILGGLNDSIIICDLDGRISSWNRGAERAYGYSEAEAIRLNMLDLVPESHKHTVTDVARRVAGGEDLESFESKRVARDGHVFDVWVSVTALHDEQCNVVALARTERDVTARRQAEREIRELNTNLERRDEVRTADMQELQEEVVRIATEEQRRIGQELHDTVQQDLTGLGLLARNLGDRLPGDSDEARLAAKLADGIADANRQVRTLAKGLVPVPIDAEGLMDALGNMARQVEETHGIACRFICPEPVRLVNDQAAEEFYRIAQEAVSNAVRHADAGEIRIDLERDEGELRLEVRDDGRGIDDAARQGGGLGLKIMAHRCGMLGGTFDARRRDSGGTSVACRVPWSRLEGR